MKKLRELGPEGRRGRVGSQCIGKGAGRKKATNETVASEAVGQKKEEL